MRGCAVLTSIGYSMLRMCLIRLFMSGLAVSWSAAIGCGGRTEKNEPPIVVDFTESKLPAEKSAPPDSLKPLNVAIAGVISPKETFVYYEEMIQYISAKMGRPIKFVQKKTYEEVNVLIGRNEIDFAFVCSGAYAEGRSRHGMELLVVPVIQGEPFYQSYIITHKTSPIHRFEDFKGRSFAFSDPLSNSGYFYAVNRVHGLGSTVDEFFSKTVFTYAHDYSIQMVAKRIVDGACIDGLIYEYLKTFHPDRIEDIRIIGKSEKFGIPPVVVPWAIDVRTKQSIQNVLLEMDRDPDGKEILSKLLIDKFQLGDESNYASVKPIRNR